MKGSQTRAYFTRIQYPNFISQCIAAMSAMLINDISNQPLTTYDTAIIASPPISGIVAPCFLPKMK